MRVRVKASRVLLHGNAEDSLIAMDIENPNSSLDYLSGTLHLMCIVNMAKIPSHLLLVGGVESEDPHEEEVGARAEDENWAGEGEGVEEIPGQAKHCNCNSNSTDPQPYIAN